MGERPVASRSRARRAVVQALYQWQLTRQSAREVETQFLEERPMANLDVAYFCELLRGISRLAEELDRGFEPLLDRPLAQLDPVERAVLRLGVFELGHRKDVPGRVVINEAVDLAKVFGAEQSHKYINGILDKMARELRAEEFSSPA